jgi:Na+-transporting NADH:ubiquinone oxidoreductase subunit NqrB
MSDTMRPRRSLTLPATILFCTAYAGVMILLLAPKETFQATPASLMMPAAEASD